MVLTKLTDKQRKFCEEYLVDLNATKAAERAGFGSPNVQSARLMKNVKVQEFIQASMDKRSERTYVTVDLILNELLKIATVDIARAYDPNGKLLPIHDIPEDMRRAIAGVDVYEEFDGFGKERVQTGETKKLKLFDKLKALEMLGKHLKLFTDKIEHSGKLSWEELVMGSLKED